MHVRIPEIYECVISGTLQMWLGSVQFSHSVVSDLLQPHELQHVRLPCPSPTPRACSNSCALSQWCYSTILSFVVPFSSCLQSFPASGSFPMSQFFASGDQNIGVSASASVLPINTQGWLEECIRCHLYLFPNTLATWCKELTHWKRPWCWDRLKVRGEGDNRGWDGWIASPTQGTWIRANGEGQGGLACCSPWGHKESDMTWLRHWTTTTSCFYVI